MLRVSPCCYTLYYSNIVVPAGTFAVFNASSCILPALRFFSRWLYSDGYSKQLRKIDMIGFSSKNAETPPGDGTRWLWRRINDTCLHRYSESQRWRRRRRRRLTNRFTQTESQFTGTAVFTPTHLSVLDRFCNSRSCHLLKSGLS
jgi:hypothetical protein